MREVVCNILVAVQVTGCWVAGAQTNLVAGASQPGALIAVSPSGLDFGLVGVGRTKDLTLTVKNVGGDVLAGLATVSAPFSIVGGGSYSLPGNQSQQLTVRYQPTADGKNAQRVVFSGGSATPVPVTGSALTPPPPPGRPQITSATTGHAPARGAKAPQFAEAESADFIARYYSDTTSYSLKPAMMEGGFQTPCDRALLLKLASQQPRHELAVIVMVHYPSAASEEPNKLAWVNDLSRLGYRRIVFLRSGHDMRVNGLTVLDYPQAVEMTAGK